ncbi:MAG: glycosyltransferase, exosortase A system-associated [Acidobacteriota bacterium]|jgi:PEP-CTERM/exosortase A-associated glycosyltransferase|nr:glycosyltransferase, exosortase A system-associated [Acidobacteriota bacterium]
MMQPSPSNKSLRILHILDHSLPLHSGYTFRSRSIFRAQAERGWRLSILTSPKHQESWKGKWEPRETIGDFAYYRTPLNTPPGARGWYELQLIRALKERILEVAALEKPDVIHAHSPVLNAIAAQRAARRLGIPLLYEIRAFWEDAAVDHGSYREDSPQYHLVRMLETRFCRKAGHVTVICEGLRRDLIQRGIPESKISIIANGIDAESFQDCPPDRELLENYSLKRKRVIGFLGSFYRYEGLDLAIDAFSLLASRHEDYVLLLVGGGEMESSLKEKARSLGLADRVIFPGRMPHDRMPGVYALTDVLVYPRNPMRLTDLVTPLKPLEAMAMGKAVVASDVGGHRELIENGKNGMLFPSGDVEALASSIEKLLSDDNMRSALSRYGREWVRRERSWQKTTAPYGPIYTKLTENYQL